MPPRRIAALALSAVLAASCAEPPLAPVEERPLVAADAPAGPCSVELYGDSILHGGYIGDRRLKEPPAAALRRLRPRYTVIDHAVNAETATGRFASFAREKRLGRFVVIEHGLNDALQGLPAEPPLRAMALAARSEGREVILTGLSRTLAAQEAQARGDAVVRQLARDMDIPFADWGSVPWRPADMADVLHPGQAYSVRLVERLADLLDALAPECK